MQRCLKITLRLLRGDKDRIALLLDKDDDKFCGLGFARVASDGMNIVGAFIKGLTWCEGDFFPASHLHDNGSFKHIHKSVSVVPMDRVG